MISVDLNDVWNMTDEKVIKAANEATNSINRYLEFRKNNNYSKEKFELMYNDFGVVTNYWVGNTFVGIKKNQNVKIAFSNMFKSFMDLLLFLKSNSNNSNLENILLFKGLYKGNIYRYLGNGEPLSKEKINFEYDNLYVSWSKIKEIDYIKQKLYGEYLLITGIANEDQYGINICALGIGRSFEEEIIFPTIKSHIIDVEKRR